MPEIICTETKASTYEGGDEINRKQFGLIKKTFTTVYQILADNASQTEDDILNTPGLPPLWLFLRGAYCVKRVAKEVNTQALLWEATCDFSTEINPENENNKDPESALPQWTWSVEFNDRLMLEDVNGKPIRTTAGEPLFYEHPQVMPILTITRFQSVFPPDTILNYCNHINQTEFWGAPRGSALCSGIADRQDTINSVNYRQVTYTFKFRLYWKNATLEPDSWNTRLLNHGSYYFCDPFGINPPPEERFQAGFRCAFEDAKGRPTTGNILENGEENKSSNPEDLHYEEFQVYEYAEFNDLNLGPF